MDGEVVVKKQKKDGDEKKESIPEDWLYIGCFILTTTRVAKKVFLRSD
jgi:hypothetical protein